MAARADASGGARGRLKSAVLWRVVGVIVLVVATVTIAGVRMGFLHLGIGQQDEDSVLAKAPAASAPAAPAASGRVANRADTGSQNLNLDAPAAEPVGAKSAGPAAPAAVADARRAGARLASSSGSGAPVVTAVTPDAPRPSAQMAHLDEHVTYQYNALGRRDPFQSLLSGDFVGADVGGDAPPDPGGMKIVGIVWGASDQFAMVEDVRGNSYVLRKGDKLQNGYVESLRRDAVVVNVTADGQSQQVVIPFVRKGESNAR